MKICNNCKELKPLDLFGKNRSRKDGLNYCCKPCVNSRSQKWRNNHPGFGATHYHLNKDQYLDRHYRKAYGIDLRAYQEMFDKQEGKCLVCNTHQSSLTKALSVDHCHTTGKVRGLLCGSCNRGIGYLKDSVKILQNAINYLES